MGHELFRQEGRSLSHLALSKMVESADVRDVGLSQLGASDLESGISGQKSATSQMGELPNRPASVPVVTTSDGPSASTSVSEAWSEGHEKDAAWNATSDLMDVNSGGDDWGALLSLILVVETTTLITLQTLWTSNKRKSPCPLKSWRLFRLRCRCQD